MFILWSSFQSAIASLCWWIGGVEWCCSTEACFRVLWGYWPNSGNTASFWPWSLRSGAIGPTQHVLALARIGLTKKSANVPDTPAWFKKIRLLRLQYLQLNSYFTDTWPALTKAQRFFRTIFFLTEFVKANIQRVTCSSWSLYCVEPFFLWTYMKLFYNGITMLPFLFGKPILT